MTALEPAISGVTGAADRACPVPVGFVRLHDAAAAGAAPVPEPAGQSHDTPSSVELSAVAAIVADNYGACHGNAQQLTDLQAWIRAQQAEWATAR